MIVERYKFYNLLYKRVSLFYIGPGPAEHPAEN